MTGFDQAQSVRLGQRLPIETTTVTMFNGSQIPEASWDGRMIYRPDRQVIQIYRMSTGAYEDVIGGVGGQLTFVGSSIPVSHNIGDLWFDSGNGNRLYRAASVGADAITAGEWILMQDSAAASTAASAAQSTANTAVTNAATAQTTANSKVKTFYQTSAPTATTIGDIWYDTDDNNKMYRASATGSGSWVSVQDGLLYADPATYALSAPGSSPTIRTVVGDAVGLTVVTDPIAPSTKLDYYIDGVVVLANQRSNITHLTLDSSGNAMVVGTTYTVTVVAKNNVGSATASAGIPGQLNPGMSETDVVAIIEAGFILAGAIQIGSTMTLDEDGLTILHPDGRQTYMHSDGSGNQFVGQATLDSATILDSLTIQGQGNALAGKVTMSTGVSDPSLKPTVTSSWDTDTFSTTGTKRRGLCEDGANANWVTTDWQSQQYGKIQIFAKSDGSVISNVTMQGLGPNMFEPTGITCVGTGTSRFWAVGQDWYDGTGRWWLRKFNTSGVGGTGTTINDWNGDELSIGTDGTNLLVVKRTYGGGLFITTYDTTLASLSTISYGTDPIWSTATPGGCWKATVDTGTSRFVVPFSNGKIVVLSSTTGSRISSEEWPAPASTMKGVCKDGSSVWHTYNGYSTVYHHTDLSGTYDFAYTWVDDDAGGTGTAETKISPKRTTAPTKRARWTISLPSAPPDDGTTDGANTASLYAIATGGTLVRQAALSEGTLNQTFSSLLTSGTNPPGTSGFASRAGATGELASAAGGGTPIIDLKGDGSGRVGPFKWNTSGARTDTWEQRGSVSVSVSGATSGTQSVSFGTSFASAPIVTLTTIGTSVWHPYLQSAPGTATMTVGVRHVDATISTSTVTVHWVAREP